MAVLLALGSAITFGVADFLGGLASRRVAAWAVVIGSQAAGLVLLVVLLPVLPDADVVASDLAWGAAGGMAGAIGLTQFFRGLAIGSMSVVAPVSAVLSAGVPVIVGVGLGERPAPAAWLGIALGIPAIALISRAVADPEDALASEQAIVAAVVAGIGFGGFFVFLGQTGDGAGIVPLVASRTVSVTSLAVVGSLTGRLARPDRRTMLVIAVSGVLDMTANVQFLYAVREGLLSLGSVISAMYPASTIVLARLVLDERLGRVQVVGLAAAATAIALVAAA